MPRYGGGMDVRHPTKAAPTDLLVEVITGVQGGTDEHWGGIIGPVHRLPIIDSVRSNRAVIPGGMREERTVIGQAVKIVRQAHPYVNGSLVRRLVSVSHAIQVHRGYGACAPVWLRCGGQQQLPLGPALVVAELG